MRKIIIDFGFDQSTGESRLLVNLEDDGMTAFEMNEAIADGEILDEVLKQTAALFGDELAEQVRNGQLKAVCLDNDPDAKGCGGGILINEEAVSRQELKQ